MDIKKPPIPIWRYHWEKIKIIYLKQNCRLLFKNTSSHQQPCYNIIISDSFGCIFSYSNLRLEYLRLPSKTAMLKQPMLYNCELKHWSNIYRIFKVFLCFTNIWAVWTCNFFVTKPIYLETLKTIDQMSRPNCNFVTLFGSLIAQH